MRRKPNGPLSVRIISVRAESCRFPKRLFRLPTSNAPGTAARRDLLCLIRIIKKAGVELI